MDFHLKQWRNHQHQHESEHQQHSAKIPNLLEDQPSSVLPLFVSEPDTKISNLSAAALPRMGSYFSLAQWQELELQALIYRYIIAGTAVPPQLLLPIKKSLHLQSSPFFLHNYQPSAMLQTGYWGKSGMDPEPGRCRRTDGKKWRCSKDVVAGRRYCERHMNRGRNRSRKPVEMPTSNGPSFGLSGPSPSIDLLHLNQSASDSKTENSAFFKPQNDGHILRHFMDERSIQETDNATCLSISLPGNSSSDVSLKLSTGNSREQAQPQLNWPAGWESFPITSMGGPLAEALRSSGSDSSPTSVLHQLSRGSISETSFAST